MIAAILQSKFGLWLSGIASALLAFFAPISIIFHVIIAVVILDCVTAIIRTWIRTEVQNKGLKKLINKIKLVKSHKLRRTILKLFFYLLIVALIYAAEIAIFGTSFYITNFGGFLIIFAELISICENIDLALGTTRFVGIINQVRKLFESKISSKIEDKKE